MTSNCPPTSWPRRSPMAVLPFSSKVGKFSPDSAMMKRRRPSLPLYAGQYWRALMALAMLEFAGLLALGITAEHMAILPSAGRLAERLQDASEALTKALHGPGNSPVCAIALRDAIKDVNEAQLLISRNESQYAGVRVAAAKESNAYCLNHVALLEDSQALYSLTLEADKSLNEAETLLPITATFADQDRRQKPVPVSRDTMDFQTSSSTSQALEQTADIGPQWQQNSQQCSSNQVDGTVCQFSACAQGRNLVSCAIGFAKGVVGGYNGQSYTVTSDQDHPDNPPPGTLRYGLNLARNVPGGVWITFSRDVKIELRAMLWVHSHTTIDGRGFNVTIHQHSLVLSGAKQVILENIQVNSVRGGDTVHIFSGCWKIWVDHVTSFGGDLGLVSVLQGSTDVTISNCKLSNHNFNMLLGASDNDEQDKYMRVSVYRNHFVNSMQRMPHCRWGWCHVANNLYTNWGYYAIGARVNARVKTENNVFMPGRVTEVTPWHAGATSGSFDFSARIESKGDILMNGATFHQFLTATHDVRPPYPNGGYPPIIPAYKVRSLVSSCAGAHPAWSVYWCQKAA